MLTLPAVALEFGPAPNSLALAQPLDFSVPLRMEPGESIAQDCVTADVTLGDEHMPRSLVRARLERTGAESAFVRVTSTLAVNEPLVQIEIALGCPARLIRRFVVLADPSADSAVVALPVVRPVPEAMRDAPPPAAARLAPSNETRRTESVPPGASAPVQRARVPQEAVAVPRPGTDPAGKRAATRAPEPATAARDSSRLKVDAIEPPSREARPLAAIVEEAIQAIEAVAQSASSARGAASAALAASTASARIAALEKTVTDLHKESQAQRDLMLQMQAQMMAAQAASRWTLPLLLMLAALAVLAGWLAWRLRQLQGGAPRPADRPATGEPGVASAARDNDVMSVPPHVESTIPPSVGLHADSPRDVSIEELIDLEQQAEFFIALGQEDAAIELLAEHMRHTGGGSPLAYLKLLEIYKSLGDRPSYERIRLGFNQRFNAYAPVWEADLQDGLTLEDYPEVVQHLQTVWSRPVAAMAELGMLIFHTVRGDVFDLPAYREVLFLYALARDLADHDGPTLDQVDFMASLRDVAGFGETAQHADVGNDSDSVVDAVDSQMATSLVDLDVHLDLELDTYVDPDIDPDRKLDVDLTDPSGKAREARLARKARQSRGL